MPISALPTPPSRQDPTNFNDRADAFLGALPQFQTEANALQNDVNQKQLDATYSATLAAASELAAANTANATIWVSGTYAVGVNRFSPSNFRTYRRKIAGTSSTDPASDPSGWQLLTSLGDVDTTSNQSIAGVKTFTSSIVGNLTGTASTANSLTANALSQIYPVGSIYINAGTTTNPASLLGFGTWVAYGGGRVLLGVGTLDINTFSLNDAGGSYHANVVAHTHTATVTDPGHSHSIAGSIPQAGTNQTPSAVTDLNSRPQISTTNSATTGITVGLSTTGSSGTNANLQPYITVAMWYRTA